MICDSAGKAETNWPLLALMRFILAMIVFAGHTTLINASPGIAAFLSPGAAVAGFFVISGFSIASSLQRGGPVSGFYERRFYRIWPLYAFAYFLSLLPCLLHQGVYTWLNGPVVELPDRWTMVQQMLMLQPGTVATFGGNPVTWSIGIEAAFYVFAPFFARSPHQRQVGIIAVSFALGVWAGYNSWHLNEMRYAIPYIAFFWMWGMGFMLFHSRHVAAVQHSAMLMAMATGWGSCTVAACLLLIIYQHRLPMHRWAKAALYAGELSYPLYICHDPVMALVSLQWPDCPTPLYYVAGLATAALAYHLIDHPLRSWHAKRYRQEAVTSAPQVAHAGA